MISPIQSLRPQVASKGGEVINIFYKGHLSDVKTRFAVDKTKYFRLRLSDKVGTERPERDLRETGD